MPAARKQNSDPDEMRPEYDFSGGVRGKYAADFARGTNVVVLAPDVAVAFKTARAVNDALRSHLRRKPARVAAASKPLKLSVARRRPPAA
jgi:hypothetical protein